MYNTDNVYHLSNFKRVTCKHFVHAMHMFLSLLTVLTIIVMTHVLEKL